MIESRLVEADLRGAYLRGANLTRAQMSELTRLDRVDLRDVILEGADLRRVSLELTNVVDVKEVKGAKFANNIGLSYDAKRQLKQRGAELADTLNWDPLSWIQNYAEPIKVIIAGLGLFFGSGGVAALVRWLTEQQQIP